MPLIKGQDFSDLKWDQKKKILNQQLQSTAVTEYESNIENELIMCSKNTNMNRKCTFLFMFFGEKLARHWLRLEVSISFHKKVRMTYFLSFLKKKKILVKITFTFTPDHFQVSSRFNYLFFFLLLLFVCFFPKRVPFRVDFFVPAHTIFFSKKKINK